MSSEIRKVIAQDDFQLTLKTKEEIENFRLMVETLADVMGEPTSFVGQAIMKARSLGLPALSSFNSFWNIQGKASMKASAIEGLLVSKGGIIKPFEIIEDCKPLFWYIKGDYVKIVKEYITALLEKNPKMQGTWASMEEVLGGWKKMILYKKPTNSADEIHLTADKGGKPYDYVTTLRGTRVYPNGRVDIRDMSYYYSIAAAKGIPTEKDGTTLKKAWHNQSQMMRKRCADLLAEYIAPDIMHNYEDLYSPEEREEIEIEKEGQIHCINVDAKDITHEKE